MLEALTLITALSLLFSFFQWKSAKAQNLKLRAAHTKYNKEQEQMLEKTQSERRELSLLLNAFDDALLITDSQGVIQVVNQASRELCSGRALRGNTIKSAFLDQEICENIYHAIATANPVKKKIVLHSSSFGKSQAITNSAWILDATPMPSQDDGTLHRIILRDVSSEHNTDQIKREFVANASHELRTPLAIISGYLENLIDDDVVDSPKTARKFLTTIRKHSDRIGKLIDEMLTISRLESGDPSLLTKEPFQLETVLDDITDRLNPITTKQSATINLQCAPENITILGDQFYWEQALFNLVENALKQNSETPITIDIHAKLTDKHLVEITITDNGKGIPSAHLPYIFNRFYRVQKHHSQSKIKGTGLGLSIVKHAIEMHGGTISATSQPGVHTTFTLSCPTHTQESE